MIREEDGHKSCLIQNTIKLLIDTEKTGDIRLSIDPSKIKILTDQDIHTEKNIHKGRLIQVTDEQDLVRAVVDIGIPLNILLPKNELKDRPVYIGDKVGVFCPVDGFRIL